jgi:hypothetical protein
MGSEAVRPAPRLKRAGGTPALPMPSKPIEHFLFTLLGVFS